MQLEYTSEVIMNFYLLEHDLRIMNTSAIRNIPNHIDPLDWQSGKKMPPPGKLYLETSNTKSDFMPDMMGSLLILFSNKLMDSLIEFGIKNIDYFPVEIKNISTNQIHHDYWLANIIGKLECVDKIKSPESCFDSWNSVLEKFYIDPGLVGDNLIFRLHEKPRLIIINEELRKFLMEKNLKGVRMRHTKVYDGF